ncbi:MAG: hypothetical protein AAF984_04030 [Verrucomicrobiota bacterium]
MKNPSINHKISKYLLLLCSVLLLMAPHYLEAQNGTGGDPTQPSTEMEEVLRALRANENNDDDDNNDEDEDEFASIVGLVVGSNQIVAHFIRIEDNYYGVQEGMSVSHKGREFLVKEITISEIVLEEIRSGAKLSLFSTLWSAPNNRSLNVPSDQNKGIALIEMRGVPLFGVAQAISHVTGVKIAVSADARATPIGIHLENVNHNEILDTLTLTHGLYKSEVPNTNIIRLHTSSEYARDANTFFEERTQIFTLKYPNARDVALSINDLFGDRVQLTTRIDDDEDSGDYLSDDLQQRLERFDTIDGRSRGLGSISQGATRSSTSSSTSSLSSRNNNNDSDSRNSRSNQRSDEADRVDRIELGDDLTEQDIAALEAADPEAMAEFIQARADIYVTVIDRLNKLMVRTRDEKTMKEIEALVQDLDVPTPLVLLEVRIFSVQLENDLDTAFEWTWSEAGSTTSVNFAPGGSVTNPTLAFTALDERFTAAMSLLQQKNRLTALGQPTLLTVNNEVSRIFIGEEVPIITGFTPADTIVVNGSAVVQNPTPEYDTRAVGSTLLITPNINDDRTVTLRMLQEESTVQTGGATILVPDGAGFVNRDIDTVTEQSASGTFAAKDGQTIAVGGLIRDQIRDNRSQIPLLGDIPLLGLAFRSSEKGRGREEIVILMTPHIISTPGEGEAISRRVIENQNALHPLLPEGKGSLELFNRKSVIQPSTDELDWDAYWKPKFGFPDNEKNSQYKAPKEQNKQTNNTNNQIELQNSELTVTPRQPQAVGLRDSQRQTLLEQEAEILAE